MNLNRFIVICIAVAIILGVVAICFFTSLDVEATEVNATVTKMEYKKAHTQMVPYRNPSTKTTTVRTVRHPAKYWVTVTYEDVSITVNNKDIFESVQEGDTLKMIYCKYYNKAHKLVMEKLKFPK